MKTFRIKYTWPRVDDPTRVFNGTTTVQAASEQDARYLFLQDKAEFVRIVEVTEQ
jgi:hypothetical protein